MALALGYASPALMLRSMTSAELTEWYAFYYLEPFGDVSNNVRIAKIGSDLINSLTNSETTYIDYMAGVKEDDTLDYRTKKYQDKLRNKLDSFFGRMEEKEEG